MRDQQPTYRRYDDEFRQDALSLLRRSSRTMKAVAADLGIPQATLHSWYKTDMAKRGKKVSRKSSGSAVLRPESETLEEKLRRLEDENIALRRENDELKTDRAILKKAAAFFAKESE